MEVIKVRYELVNVFEDSLDSFPVLWDREQSKEITDPIEVMNEQAEKIKKLEEDLAKFPPKTREIWLE